MLRLEKISIRFGGLVAVDKLDAEIGRGSITALIGPNGAGKTTVFNLISGVFAPLEGSISFQNRAIAGFKPYKVNELGIARTYQNIQLFNQMSVLENVLVGAHTKASCGFWASIARTGRERGEERSLRSRALEMLDFVGLIDSADHVARNLPYGEQKKLEIARALASAPKLLLLDEPVAGMNAREKTEVMSLIRKIQGSGITVLIVEHDMKVVMGLADEIYVMNYGKKIAMGRPAEIIQNPSVIEAYLGVEVAMPDILAIENLHYYYGAVYALKGISIGVRPGEIVALLGSNGAGKTTTLRCISGLLGRVAQGRILFKDAEIQHKPAEKIAAGGISHVLEGRHIFSKLTVKENLILGAFGGKSDSRARLDYVYGLFPRLREREEQEGGTLSGGEQQMLALGRALMSEPAILLMDEPSLGLAPLIVKEIFRIIKKINEDGMTILLVEQNSRAALNIAHRGYVLVNGEIALSDSAEKLINDENVRKKYLGEE